MSYHWTTTAPPSNFHRLLLFKSDPEFLKVKFKFKRGSHGARITFWEAFCPIGLQSSTARHYRSLLYTLQNLLISRCVDGNTHISSISQTKVDEITDSELRPPASSYIEDASVSWLMSVVCCFVDTLVFRKSALQSLPIVIIPLSLTMFVCICELRSLSYVVRQVLWKILQIQFKNL